MNKSSSIKVKEVPPSHLLLMENTQLDHVSQGSKSMVANENLITAQDTSQQCLLMSLIHCKPVFIVSIKLPILYIQLIIPWRPIIEHSLAKTQHASWSNQVPPTKRDTISSLAIGLSSLSCLALGVPFRLSNPRVGHGHTNFTNIATTFLVARLELDELNT